MGERLLELLKESGYSDEVSLKLIEVVENVKIELLQEQLASKERLISLLKVNNKQLEKQLEEKDKEIEELKEEIEDLKGYIRNQEYKQFYSLFRSEEEKVQIVKALKKRNRTND
jgi:peptidoglycan hydrolase CwlO-like protein